MERNNIKTDTLKIDTSKYTVKKTNKVLKVLIFAGLIIWAFINLFPIYWMLTFSFKNNEEIYGGNVAGLPSELRWENYEDALWGKNIGTASKDDTGFQLPKLIRFFINSLIVTVATIAISLVAALMATFAMTRIKWRFSKTMNALFMLGITIPMHASLLPVYRTMSNLGILNTYTSLILPYSAFSLSMAILICTGFMDDIPKELDEAACIDGCNLGGIFFKVIVPLMKPALSTIGIYTFLQCWNELMFANQFMATGDKITLPVGIQQLSAGQSMTQWGPIGAALVIATFPTLLVYVFLSKRIQDSFIAGAVKG
ncbi:MAG: carbohydrate ABC transporter permease [Lachnospiraceae bacterium]|nr:carbohydrate ABC transporter permease [Lachnospiraceae bacterium]